MRAITIVFSGVFLMTALAATAMPFGNPQTPSPVTKVQEKKEPKKKNEPFKPQEKSGY